MKKNTLISIRFRFSTATMLALGLSMIAIAAVACSSSDEPDPTATSQPAVTQPTATQTTEPTKAPDPTATPEPQVTAPEPTEVPVATEVPTKTPDPTAVPPTVAPTATPDPFVVLELLATGQVDPNRFISVSPGDGELLERAFEDAPPFAAHEVGDIRITLKSNQCLTCHEGGFASGGHVATGIPLSHYTDQFTMDVSNDLDPRRYICTSCHVPQVTDPPPYGE